MGGESDSRDSVRSIVQAVEAADHILAATHRNPDGDALGSLLGLTHVLTDQGKKTIPFCPDPIPPTLRFLPGMSLIRTDVRNAKFDISIVLDTPEVKLLPDGFPENADRGRLIVIDHHLRADLTGDLALRMKSSAVGEMVHRLASDHGWPISAEAATCLYTSIVSDTSSFKYESATKQSHLAAADLISRGAVPNHVATHLFESFSLSRQRLLAAVLGTLTVRLRGRLALIHCTRRMLESAGAQSTDTSGLINFARSIDGVVVAGFVREESGGIRVSLRSKGNVNAGRIAERLGGGGHVNAGGCFLSNATLETVRGQVKEATRAVLDRDNGTVSGGVSIPT